jgi:hypothetical protein
MHRRTLVLGALAFALGARSRASAGGILPFDRSAFVAAQEAGKPIVVFVHAPW